MDSKSLYDLGQTYQEKGDYRKAIDYYLDALRTDPFNTRILNEMGVCHEYVGDKDMAKAFFEKAAGLESHRRKEAEGVILELEKSEMIENFEAIFNLMKSEDMIIGSKAQAFLVNRQLRAEEVPGLSKGLKDNAPAVHDMVAKKLAASDHRKEAEPVLFDLLIDEDENVRIRAIHALKDIDSVQAIPKLKFMAENDPSNNVRLAAKEAIKSDEI